MKIVSITGARPQFIKASVVSRALRKAGFQEIMVNTGQHYDPQMARIFFDEMEIPRPDYDLEVGSGTQAEQTAATLVRVEKVLLKEKPDLVLVYGDTNATIGGTLAAAKLHIPVAHVEAGLRSYNRRMPEEINRVVTDVLAEFLFCPSQEAVDNLRREGLERGVYLTGDVMVDALYHYSQVAETKSKILDKYGLSAGGYVLMTIHRPVNADDSKRLSILLHALEKAEKPVLFPVHPRTRKLIPLEKLADHPTIRFLDPVGYLDMLKLEKNAAVILTDSGGVQKEAYLHRVPCITLRTETEWKETVADGWNTLVFSDWDRLIQLINNPPRAKKWHPHYGDGQAASRIAAILKNHFGLE